MDESKCGYCSKISDGFFTSCWHEFHYDCAIKFLESGCDRCLTCNKKLPLPNVLLSLLLGTDIDRDYILKCESCEVLTDFIILAMYSRVELSGDLVSFLISRALELGWDINSSEKNLLIFACRANNLIVAKELLKNDHIKVNFSGEYIHPLKEACRINDLEMVKLLVEHGADINYCLENSYHVRVIVEAVRFCDLEIVNYLIEHGADLSSKDRFNNTLLHLACFEGRADIAFRLIELGVHVDLIKNYLETENTPMTVMKSVCFGGNLDIFTKISSLGAEIKITSEKEAVSYFNAAVTGGNIEILDHVISKGGKVVDGEEYPIHMACRKNQVEIVKRILEVGGNINECSYDIYKQPSLFTACKYKAVETANLLIDMGADLDLNDKLGRSPLHFAFELEQIPILMNPKIREMTLKWVVETDQDDLELKIEDLMILEPHILYNYVKSFVNGTRIKRKVLFHDD